MKAGLETPSYASIWRREDRGVMFLVSSVSTFDEDDDTLVTYVVAGDTEYRTCRLKTFLETFTKVT